MSEEVRYSNDHLWTRFEGELAYIGIMPLMLRNLGAIIDIDFPKENVFITPNEVVCSIEAIKTTYDIVLPFGGKLISTNKSLLSELDKIKQKPYESWFFIVEIEDNNKESIKKNLFSYEEYELFCKNEQIKQKSIRSCN